MREVPISCWFLAFPVVAATLSHFRIVSDILLLVVNGSEALAVARRDKDATWRKLGTLCRELDWSRSRLIHELQRGLRYRTFPEDHAINWDDPAVRLALDVEASTLPRGYASVLGLANSWTIQEAIGIEVLPPDAPPHSANAPAASQVPPRKVSEADVRKALLAIVEEHPPGSSPLDEESLCSEVERRVGAQLARDRVLAARNDVAPHFKLPVGRPRKNAQ